MTVTEYLKITFNPEDKYQVRKRIICNDGFSMSVQGGTQFHYCEPRAKVNQYECVEIGYPSEKEILIMAYSEDSDWQSVYPMVPIGVVERVVEKHNGIDVSATANQE